MKKTNQKKILDFILELNPDATTAEAAEAYNALKSLSTKPKPPNYNDLCPKCYYFDNTHKDCDMCAAGGMHAIDNNGLAPSEVKNCSVFSLSSRDFISNENK